MTQQSPTKDTARIKQIFEAQRAHQYAVANTTARERSQKLKRLHDAVQKYREEIRQALYQDMRKPPAEVDMVEIYPIVSEIKHARRNLRRWMARQPVGTPLSLFGSSSWIHYEPKGVCLIIAPWNFPVQLTLGPLISAIAAGNTAILKPSEHTPHAAALMQKLIGEVFEEREVALVQGEVETAQALLALPFNHIFFTGSPAVGKIVMTAAAKNLASVTLELGGKSPTIVDETANLKTAAARIVAGKFVNNGQVCLAPDYLFVHESQKDRLLALLKQRLQASYGDNPAASDSYGRMVNQKHFERVKAYLADAEKRGVEVITGGRTDATEGFIAPTVVTEVPMDSELMDKEIFGPVLPVHTYTDLRKVIDFINRREKPLGLYIYSKNKKNIRRILNGTRSGGACINHNAIHFYNPNLPFGGSNHSGVGKAHGWFGFEAFSNARAVYKQNLPGAIDWLTPPFNGWKQRLIDWTLRWL